MKVEQHATQVSGELTEANAAEFANWSRPYYEVYPESLVLPQHVIRQVGFRLHLYGDVGVPDGNERREEARRGLGLLASAVLPATHESCCFEVFRTPGALYYCNSRPGSHGRVRLVILIVHRDGCERPIDESQRRALEELELRLRTLGVPKGPASTGPG